MSAPITSELLDAFNACAERVSLGMPVESVLSQYSPQTAARLRPMLEAVEVARRAVEIPHAEVARAQARGRARVLTALNQAPLVPAVTAARRGWLARRGLAVAAMLAAAVAVAALLMPPDNSPAVVLEQTPLPSETPVSTDTLTPTSSFTPTLSPTPTEGPCLPEQPEGWVRYVVRSGDTLSALAVRSETTLEVLQAVNCIDDPRLIRVGQVVFLPRLPATSTAVTSPTSQPGGGTPTGGGGGSPSPTEDECCDDDDYDDDDDDDNPPDDDEEDDD